ncbi:MAG: hypothetical protein KatS3mg101_0168 [Patescibacteria group bacterium]|nr:MAG: hypothetical protein KatS3mg101_0168 [Patescibacteria group bacterium]
MSILPLLNADAFLFLNFFKLLTFYETKFIKSLEPGDIEVWGVSLLHQYLPDEN